MSPVTSTLNPAFPVFSLQLHLNDDEFAAIFKMDKPAFVKLPGWRQDKLKRDAKLF